MERGVEYVVSTKQGKADGGAFERSWQESRLPSVPFLFRASALHIERLKGGTKKHPYKMQIFFDKRLELLLLLRQC